MEDYHTDLVGRCEDGRQFFIYEPFVFPNEEINEDWTKVRREYLVLYLFDPEGNFIEIKHWSGGTTAELNHQEKQKKKDEFLTSLGKFELCDISVKLFQTTIDGVVFGLVPSEKNEAVDLQPSSTIQFTEPWDGEYYT
ncbi:hypothetical protein QEH52_19280 [Coraliomargarita sp. SDUM461003]|uniref:NERD domain-containing protein n=2 Tax=Thalassobacterium maritimum TaxID=3041265 RepID=A0ABU1AZT6_9BACT|nr:hypothetical protein [Coraliomargarita sp. SDUM461003]